MVRNTQNKNLNYAAIIENTFDAIFINDVNGNYIYVNQRAADISGYTKEELLVMNIVDLTPPDKIETVKSRIKNRLIGKNSLNIFESNLLDKNGNAIPVEITAASLEWNRKPVEMVSLREISKRKKLENELKYLSEFQNILLILGERFINFAPDKLDEIINQALESIGRFTNVDRVYIFNYDFENDYMTNTYEWCAEDITPEIENLKNIPNELFPDWVTTHKQGIPIHLPDILRLPKRSEIRKILEKQGIKSLITIPLMLQQECIGFVGFDSVTTKKEWNNNEIFMLKYFANLLVNVKERVQIENALILAKENAEKNEQIKTAFLQTMSHELRTPLNAIIGFSELIDKDMPIEEILKYCKIINQSGDHLLEMIKDIFDLSLLVAGEMKKNIEKVNVFLIANEANALMLSARQQLGKENIFYSWDFPTGIEPLTIYTDAEKLKKILYQLLLNALKFTHNGTIEFGFELDDNNSGENILFYIKDTGIGIPKEKQEIIFDVFRQADETKTRVYGGMGVGLALAKKLTDLLNGEIWFDTKQGKGSIFYVKIPVNNI